MSRLKINITLGRTDEHYVVDWAIVEGRKPVEEGQAKHSQRYEAIDLAMTTVTAKLCKNMTQAEVVGA